MRLILSKILDVRRKAFLGAKPRLTFSDSNGEFGDTINENRSDFCSIQNSANYVVSNLARGEMKHPKIYDRWKGLEVLYNLGLSRTL